MPMLKTIMILTLLAGVVVLPGCRKKFEIRDTDPAKAGTVRSLGPESQDVINVADKMLRSMINNPSIANRQDAPTVVMLPMSNNTRHAFNSEIFSSLLKSELNKQANGRLKFISRDINADIQKEREMKRAGEVDYDPNLRAQAPGGADYFLKGRADGLANVSTKGQADTILYSFKLVDAETGLDVWEDNFMTKREGKDDVIYR